MENRLYAFDWKYIGDMELGRPNLGKTARLEIYRLFQYTLRDVLETEYGTEQSDRLLYKAGFLAGTEFCKRYVGECASFSDFVAKVQAALEEMNVGILHVERADMDKLEFTLTVAEDLDCSGLPDLGHVVCTYDEVSFRAFLRALRVNLSKPRKLTVGVRATERAALKSNRLPSDT